MHKFCFCCCLLIGALVVLPVPGQGVKPNRKLTAGKLHALLEEVRTRHKLPALAAGIVRGDAATVAAVTGVRKQGEDTPVQQDDLWHLGSNSKPMTALLLALLIDLGLLDWDTPLGQIFPDLAGDWDAELKRITPVQLLTHTSGLPANWPTGWASIAPKETPAAQRAVMMKEFGNVKLLNKPREKYLYSNFGYTVIGAIIDRLGKAPWEEQIQRKIFQPLGIQRAGFGPPAKPGALLQPWPHHKSGKPVAVNGVHDNPPVMSPAGRVHMSVADYQRFLAEVLRLARGDKGLIKPATAKKLFAPPQTPSIHSLSGWVDFKGPDQKGPGFRHDGSNTLNYCTALVLPEHNLAVCVFTNQGGDDDAKAACVEVRKQFVEREK